MIRLTRLRATDPFYVNPDHIERVEQHHDTMVHLSNGTEYVVRETPTEIVDLVLAHRGRVMAVAARRLDEVVAVPVPDVDEPASDTEA